MLTQTMAKAWAPQVAVNCIAPGMIVMGSEADAEYAHFAAKTPMGRNGRSEDVAELVLYLAGATPFLPGQIIAVDGGLGLCRVTQGDGDPAGRSSVYSAAARPAADRALSSAVQCVSPDRKAAGKSRPCAVHTGPAALPGSGCTDRSRPAARAAPGPRKQRGDW